MTRLSSSSNLIDLELLSSNLKQNREHKKLTLTLENKIKEMQISTLKLLEEHYLGYKLKFELEYYEAELEYLKSTQDYHDYRKNMDQYNEKCLRLTEETVLIDNKIAEAEVLLAKYRGLNSKLLEEYQALKDDLDVQEMLIEISENNKSKD